MGARLSVSIRESFIFIGAIGLWDLHDKDERPERKMEQPVLVKAGKGMIDATPLWDEDGKVYLIHAMPEAVVG